MKKFFQDARAKMKNYWRRAMDSTKVKMSRGAQKIHRMISWARRDNWRRKNEKK